MHGALDVMSCFLLQACIFGVAVPVLWVGGTERRILSVSSRAWGLCFFCCKPYWVILNPSLLDVVPKITQP